jgi:hypothetical protein
MIGPGERWGISAIKWRAYCACVMKSIRGPARRALTRFIVAGILRIPAAILISCKLVGDRF